MLHTRHRIRLCYGCKAANKVTAVYAGLELFSKLIPLSRRGDVSTAFFFSNFRQTHEVQQTAAERCRSIVMGVLPAPMSG